MSAIIDTHCHYNLEPLNSTWQNHWQAAQAQGVVASIVVGTEPSSNLLAASISAAESQLYAAVGYHPHVYQDAVELGQAAPDPDFSQLDSLASHNSPKLVAIGEIGLDYFRVQHLTPDQLTTLKTTQVAALRYQLQLANRFNLPVILHVRDQQLPETPTPGNAYWDILTELRQTYHSSQPFILHCVSGPLAYVQAALELGAYLGMAGNITYKNADHLRSILKLAPPDRLLLETDAPYLPPHPFRGQSCEPAMIHLTAEYVRDELGLELDQVLHNSLACFSRLTLP